MAGKTLKDTRAMFSKRQKLHALLDNITDVIVPKLDYLETLGIEVTIEDREELSDWIQERFRMRAEDTISET